MNLSHSMEPPDGGAPERGSDAGRFGGESDVIFARRGKSPEPLEMKHRALETKFLRRGTLQAQSSDGTALMALPVFTPPALPTGVVAVNEGALDRLFALVQTIKDRAGFTEAIGADLDVLGTEDTMPDLATLQPVIDATAQVAAVKIGWDWGGNSAFLDMIELQVDRSDTKGFVFLANDTTPGYLDTTPFPTALTKWTYRAIYRIGDDRVGVWSNSVSVAVGG